MRICWAQWIFLLVVGVLGLGQMLTACGNKGDLMLPEDVQQSAIEKDKKSEKNKTKELP